MARVRHRADRLEYDARPGLRGTYPVTCGNPKHPRGAWHVATPLPRSRDWIERIRQWWRCRQYGCGCAN